MRISVTRKHISRGRQGCATLCPVAMALNDILPIGYQALVFETEIRIQNGQKLEFHSPRSVERFVRAFDTKKSLVNPFSFNLKVPKSKLKNLG